MERFSHRGAWPRSAVAMVEDAVVGAIHIDKKVGPIASIAAGFFVLAQNFMGCGDLFSADAAKAVHLAFGRCRKLPFDRFGYHDAFSLGLWVRQLYIKMYAIRRNTS